MHHNYCTSIYSQGKVIGRVKGGVFEKSIHGKRHLLRQPPAIAFDVDTLTQAESAGAISVRVVDQDTGITYKAQLSHIRDKGLHFNRGYGDQIALPLEGWITSMRGAGLQLSLFGEGL